MIFVCKLPINKIKGYLYSILSLSGQSSGSPYRVRQIMVLIKTVSKTKCPLFYIYSIFICVSLLRFCVCVYFGCSFTLISFWTFGTFRLTFALKTDC